MNISISTLFLALLIVVHAGPASAVQIYLTPDQGYPFQTPDDPREVDLIGAPATAAGLITLVGSSQSSIRFNLWIDAMGESLTFIGLQLRRVNGAVFTDWDTSETLGLSVPDDGSGIVGSLFTFSNIFIDGNCNDFSGQGTPSPGLPQGNCIG